MVDGKLYCVSILKYEAWSKYFENFYGNHNCFLLKVHPFILRVYREVPLILVRVFEYKNGKSDFRINQKARDKNGNMFYTMDIIYYKY